jgi:hypothetical protein
MKKMRLIPSQDQLGLHYTLGNTQKMPMNLFGNRMKSTPIALFMLALILLGLGCTENHLKWSKEQACISFDGQETCVPAGGGTYRIVLKDGKPVVASLETAKLLGNLQFPQYAPAQALETAQLSLLVENGKLVLLDGQTRLVDEIGLGILLMPDAAGKMQAMVPVKSEAKGQGYRFDRQGMLAGSKNPARKVEFLRSIETSAYAAISRIIYYTPNGMSAPIANDTGTIVIIIDTFKLVGSCDAEMPDNCCPPGEASGGIIDSSAWEDEYAAEGKRLLACFPPASLCTFQNLDKLIVIVCESQQRYCLNLSKCPVTITTTDDHGICFSVPLDCSIVNPFL